MRSYILKHKLSFFFSVLLSIINASISIGMAFILANIVNSAVDLDIKSLSFNFRLAIAYFIIYMIIAYLTNYICERFIYSVMVDFKKDLFRSIMSRNYVDYQKHNSAYYMQQLTVLCETIEGSYINSIFDVTSGLTLLILSTLSIILINYRILLVAIFLGIIYLSIGNAFSRNIEKYKDRLTLSFSDFSSTIKDLLEGYELSRSYNNENYILNRFNQVNKTLLESKKRYSIRFSNLQIYNLILGQALIVIIISISSFQVIQGSFKIGSLIAIAQLLANMVNPLLGLAEIINDIKSNKNIKKTLLDFINYPSNCNEKKKEIHDFNNLLEIKDLSFSYKNKEIFKKINLSIEAGKKYAVTGENGSGKSTLLKLITHCYNDYDGQILIDGNNIGDLSLDSLKSIFAVVSQDIYVYDDTIANNICFGIKDEKEKIYNTMEKYNLDELITNYNIYTHNAKELSGGERQKVAIARSQINRKPFMIFDEINSGLDEKSSQKVLEAILKDETITALVVTHKLSSENLDMYDEILKIEDKGVAKIVR